MPTIKVLSAGAVRSMVEALGREFEQAAARRASGSAFRFFARIFQRRIFLDVQAALRLVIEMIVGPQAGRANTGDGANIVHLVDVAGDTDGAHDLALIVANELSAGFQK